MHTYTTQAQVRGAFIDYAQQAGLTIVRRRGGSHAPQNKQPCTTRAAFVDYVDQLARAGDISQALAGRVTL